MAIPFSRPQWVLLSLLFGAAIAADALAQPLSPAQVLQNDLKSAIMIGDPSINTATPDGIHLAGGAIDITNGAMIVTTSSFGFVPSGNAGYGHEYGTPGVAEYGDAAIHDAILEGANFANGYWNGTNGIFSSAAADNPNTTTTVGWIDNDLSVGYATFRGVTVPPGSSIIAYTYYGDIDLSGYVDVADYTGLTNFFNYATGGYLSGNSNLAGGTGYVDWYDGDIDYSGLVDVSDYTNLVNLYNQPALYTAGGVVPATWNTVTVPEPASLVLLVASALCGFGLFRLRKQRRGQKTGHL